jgi:phosphotransferase system HPr (HPr) family protein
MSSEFQECRAVIVNHQNGLHLRPAHLLAELAKGFQSLIEIEKGGTRVDAKSALSIMTLGATQGTELQVFAAGPDAAEAVARLAELIASNFPEETADLPGPVENPDP